MHQVRPSLLHGDLWSGNVSTVKEGGWSILDPAVYYGHHEAEFGMSWCGGFSSGFWNGYNSVIPRAPGDQALIVITCLQQSSFIHQEAEIRQPGDDLTVRSLLPLSTDVQVTENPA